MEILFADLIFQLLCKKNLLFVTSINKNYKIVSSGFEELQLTSLCSFQNWGPQILQRKICLDICGMCNIFTFLQVEYTRSKKICWKDIQRKSEENNEQENMVQKTKKHGQKYGGIYS